MSRTDDRLLLLSPDDNVLVARAAIAEGEPILVEGLVLPLTAAISMGHKLARRLIPAGEAIVKYGAVIGTATTDIAQGAHVHTHNVRSNYTATHTLEEARVAYEAASEVGKT
ncbi:MAG: UxaA family hydrolase [Rhodobacteraceae bacterium]|jgi:altronate dehydratase small subunit|nr:UxaA family hydrolase [Paracoccaceae bacterium]